MDVRLPDGTIIQGVPDGISKADLVSKLSANGYDTSGLIPKPEKQPLMRQDAPVGGASFDPNTGEVVIDDGSRGGQANALDAFVRGIGSGLGSLMRSSNMKEQAKPYKEQFPVATGTGEFVGEVAPTLPVGGVLAKGLTKVAPAATELATAMRTGGLGAGSGGVGTRMAGGAITGGATSGLIDDSAGSVGSGAAIGAAIPGVGAAARPAAEWLMKSALKPSAAQHLSGEAQTAADTLLKYGINATKGGAEKLQGMIDNIDSQIEQVIASSNKSVDKNLVLNRLNQERQRLMNQASPLEDLAAADTVEAGFRNHPLLPTDQIPIQLAQDLKRGTYQQLRKKYGQVGSASDQSQKAVARGLKEEIALAEPAVSPLNAEQQKLIDTLKVTERRAGMDQNKNPLGLSGFAQTPSQFLMTMADKSALAKSLAARGINQLSPADKQSMLAEILRRGAITTPGLLSAD